MATHLIVSALVLVALLGCAAASLFAGVLVGEERARRRFDEALAAKFGGDSDDGGGGGEGAATTLADLLGADVEVGDDEDEEREETADDDEITIDSDKFEAEALPMSETSGGVRIAWIVSGPGPWRLC